MKLKIILMIGILLISGGIFAQKNQERTYDRLKIGDKVPDDLVFTNMHNWPEGKAKFSDFKGKMVILDFWNIWCSSCIAAFPKMQRFQEKYKDKLQVLLVNTINHWDGLVASGFPDKTRSPNISRSKLPFVLNDKNLVEKDVNDQKGTLNELFPHAGEPYQVWIDEDGIVRANTAPGYEATEESIEYFLKHKKLPGLSGETRLAEDLGMKENEKSSILKPSNDVVRNSIQYSSIILKGLNAARGIDASFIDSASGKFYGFRSRGRSILDHYIGALSNTLEPTVYQTLWNMITSNRVVLDVAEPTQYTYPKNDSATGEWMKNNYYHYELSMPLSRMDGDFQANKKKLSRIMKEDFERFFGVHSFFEKRRVPCWVLVRTSTKDKIATKGGEFRTRALEVDGINGYQNNPLGVLTSGFSVENKYRLPFKPFINETGFKEDKRIDMQIPCPLDDIEGVRKALRQYDLDLIEEVREVEVLVISDKQMVNP